MTYPLLFFVFSVLPAIGTVLAIKRASNDNSAPVHIILKSFNLCLASTVISITSVLNFSLAASLAVLLGLPTIISGRSTLHIAKYVGYMFLGLGWLLFGQQEAQQAVRNWEVLGVWFAPFICIVYYPLVLQAGLASVLQV